MAELAGVTADELHALNPLEPLAVRSAGTAPAAGTEVVATS